MLISWLGVVFSHPSLADSLSIIAKTFIVYVFLVLGLRLLGTRELGEMTTYDFVLVVVVANAVQNALVNGDNTLFGGLLSAATLLLTNATLTSLLDRIPWLAHRLIGQPVLLVSDGTPSEARMRREGISNDELIAALREHGMASIADVRMAVLEVDGTISIVPMEATVHRTHRHVRGLRVT